MTFNFQWESFISVSNSYGTLKFAHDIGSWCYWGIEVWTRISRWRDQETDVSQGRKPRSWKVPSNWFKLVSWLATSNQSALPQRRVATLLIDNNFQPFLSFSNRDFFFFFCKFLWSFISTWIGSSASSSSFSPLFTTFLHSLSLSLSLEWSNNRMTKWFLLKGANLEKQRSVLWKETRDKSQPASN